MNFVCIFLGILFCTAGILFACSKGHIHLAAWKSMPEEEKRKIKIIPLCRSIGEVIALSGVIFLLKGLWPGLSQHWFIWAVTAWFVIAGFAVCYIGKSKRYRNP